MSKIRLEKIADLIRKELSVCINYEIRDPRIDSITLTKAKVSADLGIAYLYFTTMGDPNKLKLNEEILNKASSHLRTVIAPRLSLRKIPALKFFIDDTLDYYNHINSILKKINDDQSSSEQKD